jgi:hypothetical protein
MAELLLDSLEIKNFRVFDHLQIEKLGRVNLIVGKNSVGKTALLEVLWLYSNKGSFNSIADILSYRKEYYDAETGLLDPASISLAASSRFLFKNRPGLESLPPPIQIGAIGIPAKTLSMAVQWFRVTGRNGTSTNLQGIQPEELENFSITDKFLGLSVDFAGKVEKVYNLNRSVEESNKEYKFREKSSGIFIKSGGLELPVLYSLWQNVTLTSSENEVIGALQLVVPDVERVNMLGTNGTVAGLVKTKTSSVRFPLTSLGDGVNKVFGITLALVNTKDSFVLVDEVENGLHHSVQVDFWKLIFRLAHELNVQIFATTHSWDCVEAFQEAAAADSHEEAMLIRLQNKGGRVVPVTIDENVLKNVVEQEVEIR